MHFYSLASVLHCHKYGGSHLWYEAEEVGHDVIIRHKSHDKFTFHNA